MIKHSKVTLGLGLIGLAFLGGVYHLHGRRSADPSIPQLVHVEVKNRPTNPAGPKNLSAGKTGYGSEPAAESIIPAQQQSGVELRSAAPGDSNRRGSGSAPAEASTEQPRITAENGEPILLDPYQALRERGDSIVPADPALYLSQVVVAEGSGADLNQSGEQPQVFFANGGNASPDPYQALRENADSVVPSNPEEYLFQVLHPQIK